MKKHRSIWPLLLGIGSLLLLFPALSSGQRPPPPILKEGPYLRGSGMFLWPKLDKEFYSGLGFTRRTDQEFGYSGGVGYAFAPREAFPHDGGRFTIEIDFSFFKVSNAASGILGPDDVETEEIETMARQLFATDHADPGFYRAKQTFNLPLLMVHFQYEYEFLRHLTWWISGGAGAAFPEQIRTVQTPMGEVKDRRHDMVAVGQLRAGARYYFTENVALAGNYRFLTMGGPPWNFGDGLFEPGRNKIRAQGLEASLTYFF